jgi:hypothetical protein
MSCPFPGMDPYIERTAIFPDFHDSLITCIRAAMQPLVRPKYVALTQDRLVLVEADRPRFPDVAVIETIRGSKGVAGTGTGGTLLLDPDDPAVFQLGHEEIRQPYLTIIEPAAGNRIITAIEVLSPTNKESGEGRKSYLAKRDEFWDSGVNLVEIDLLRDGARTVRVSQEKLEQLRPWHYLVAVTRREPLRQEVYAFPLQQRLPRVAIPLAPEDKDVVLDLPAVFTRCWNEGPYPELLFYEGPPPGTIAPEDLRWCEETLTRGGYR